MSQKSAVPEQASLTRLHAATGLAMTQFINGHHCPKLAHLIVRQLSLLVAHPDLEAVSASRDMYLQLLEHWQKVTSHLLEQQAIRSQTAKFH